MSNERKPRNRNKRKPLVVVEPVVETPSEQMNNVTESIPVVEVPVFEEFTCSCEIREQRNILLNENTLLKAQAEEATIQVNKLQLEAIDLKRDLSITKTSEHHYKELYQANVNVVNNLRTELAKVPGFIKWLYGISH